MDHFQLTTNRRRLTIERRQLIANRSTLASTAEPTEDGCPYGQSFMYETKNEGVTKKRHAPR